MLAEGERRKWEAGKVGVGLGGLFCFRSQQSSKVAMETPAIMNQGKMYGR